MTRTLPLNFQKKTRLRSTAGLGALCLLSGLLAGCGGGGGGGGSGAGFPLAIAPAADQSQAAEAPAPKPPADCSMELYGDSIAVGNLVLDTPVAKRIGLLRPFWSVKDHSARGMSAAVLSSSFPNDTRTGRVVAFALGTNDLNLGISPAAPLRAMADYAKAEGRKIIITGIPRLVHPRVDEFNADELALTRELGATWAAWPDVPHETLDGTHPTQAMSDALADRLVAAMEATAPECKP